MGKTKTKTAGGGANDGGEPDLVALAMRLAFAVVEGTERGKKGIHEVEPPHAWTISEAVDALLAGVAAVQDAELRETIRIVTGLGEKASRTLENQVLDILARGEG